MSVAVRPGPLPARREASVPLDPIWRLTVQQYHRMIRTGILTEEDPVELLEGWLVVKMPKNPPHSLATQLIRLALERRVPSGWFVNAQEPITTHDSEPEPDISVVRGERRDYSDHHPGPQDLAMVVEVADTTLQRDRISKKRLYAAAGVAAYWILNLVEAQIEVYTQPTGPVEEPDYGQQHVYARAEEVPLEVEGNEVGCIRVAEVLP